MKFQIMSFSDTGNTRSNNEDSVVYGVDKKQGICWLALADGMGGHKAGEVASEMLTNWVAKEMAKSRAVSNWQQFAAELISHSNYQIYQHAEANEDCAGMGTTGIVLICDSQQGYLAWVGDSRCYLWREGKVKLLSRDHSMLHYLVDKGSISEQDAAEAPGNNMLARAVGVKTNVEVDSLNFELRRKDRLLLSSDGLHDAVGEALLAELLSQPSPQLWQKNRWLESALKAGSRDNISLILLGAE